jgi:protein-disulfide isomerase
LVRFAFRHFAFIGDESRWAAEAAECANEQDRFWDYYDKIFEEQAGENVGSFGRENLKRFADDLGLDTTQFNQCLDSGKYSAKVQQEIAQGRQAGVHSTPALLVNGRLIERGSDYQVLQAAIEAALKSGSRGRNEQ